MQQVIDQFALNTHQVDYLCSLSGTSFYYAPGALNGGSVEHDCSLQRSIGYYLELILYLAPFMKIPLEVRLKGVTNDRDDPSVSFDFENIFF